MNIAHSTFGYWDLNPHLLQQTEQELENRAKHHYYQSAMCLMNPKQDPPIFSHHTQNNIACKEQGCECIGTEAVATGHEEQFLKFVHTSETIEVEVDATKIPLPSEISIKDSHNFKVEERPYKCDRPDCNKTFLLKHHLTTHEKTHTGERPHVCIHCGKSFTHKYCLNTHLLLHTNERPHLCTECNKRFTLKHHLISHINVHKRDKPWLCGECGKSFPLRKQLITHEKFHKGERPFLCNECGDTFAQENHLVMHLRFHGSLTSFVCGECGATFTRKFELDNHERLHGKEPLVCTICSKQFLQKRTLLTHQKSHANKITCHFCGEQYTENSTSGTPQDVQHYCKTKKHVTISKPKPEKSKLSSKINKNKKYYCDICFRKFGAKHGLTQHKKRQHNIGSNLFSCHICNKSFRQKDELLMHKHNP